LTVDTWARRDCDEHAACGAISLLRKLGVDELHDVEAAAGHAVPVELDAANFGGHASPSSAARICAAHAWTCVLDAPPPGHEVISKRIDATPFGIRRRFQELPECGPSSEDS